MKKFEVISVYGKKYIGQLTETEHYITIKGIITEVDLFHEEVKSIKEVK